jgi:predicted DCC family thiol-disulfide oxidoreductase YuxK
MKNEWSGGKYSIFRILFGCYLLYHFLALLPWGAELFSNQGVLANASASPLIHLFPNVLAICDRPGFVIGLLILGSLLSVLLAAGIWDRPAAFALWYLWACLLGRNPLISNPAIPFIGWLLLLHTVLPNAPYGSWAARKRENPGGNWHMPQLAFVVAWVLMAAGYSYSGYTKLVSPSWLDGSALARMLENPLVRPTVLRSLLLVVPPVSLRVLTWTALLLELSFAPLALFRKARPWIWTAMVGMHIALLSVVSFAELSIGMLLLHLFTFDPAWLPRRIARRPEYVFYDGNCALCQGWVRFVLAEDLGGTAFRLSPLKGEFFLSHVQRENWSSLPDSLVVLTEDKKLLTRSAAILYVLRSFGGLWLLLALIVRAIPRTILDWCYDRLAGVRIRVFGKCESVCPILPAELRRRFDL